MALTRRHGASRSSLIVLSTASLALVLGLAGCKDKDEGDEGGSGGGAVAGAAGDENGGQPPATAGAEQGGEAGGAENTGGAATGGVTPTGGVAQTGGATPTGGVVQTGGVVETGGTAGEPPVTGGVAGQPVVGGAAGAPATGGAGGAPGGAAGVDECTLELDDCAENAACFDATNGFLCVCLDGYAGDGVTCTDVDECDTGADDCSENATCTNTPGGYTCECDAGFAGDGVSCPDINECGTDVDDCSADATCTNEPGSYTCECNAGFTGDGVTCTDVDECDTGADNCSADATCANEPGSFTCTCNEGFTGNGVVCSTSCGDGVTSGEEQCDDANDVAGDGCSSCAVDPGWECLGSPSSCESVCGNGLVSSDEECDDGNSAELDGCTSDCTLECGDGAINGIESVTIEYFTSDCAFRGIALSVNGKDALVLPGGACLFFGSPVPMRAEITAASFLSSFELGTNTLTVMGAGETGGSGLAPAYTAWVVITAHYRDIGDEEVVAYDFGGGGDAASRNPDILDAGYETGAESAFDLAAVGVAGETCDDGNRESGDGCTATCKTECGNSVIEDIEECDDGNSVSRDGCSASCGVEHGATCRGQPSLCSVTCGDGAIAVSEECDDGNRSSGDGCSASCDLEGGWDCDGEPTACSALGPGRSCVGNCGTWAPMCYCDVLCSGYGDCCADFVAACFGDDVVDRT